MDHVGVEASLTVDGEGVGRMAVLVGKLSTLTFKNASSLALLVGLVSSMSTVMSILNV